MKNDKDVWIDRNLKKEIKRVKDLESMAQEIKNNGLLHDVMLVSCPNCSSKEQIPFFDYFKCMNCQMRHDGQDEA